jgi:RecA-family ATPase
LVNGDAVRLLNLTDYPTLDRPNMGWVIEGLLPRPGLTMLLGPPKSGKTFLALQVALAVAGGTPFAGRAVTRTRVLYLQFDASDADWQMMIRGVAAHVAIPRDIYTIHPDDMLYGLNLLYHPHYQYLDEAIRTCDPGLVIIDVLREIHNADEDDSTEQKVVGDALTRLTEGRACLLLHHTRKASEAPPSDLLSVARGTSYWAGKVSAGWLLEGKTETAAVLHVQPRVTPRQTLRLVRDGRTGLWTFPPDRQPA